MANKREKEKQKRKKLDVMSWLKETKESSGGEATLLKLPEGFEEWKPEEGVYEIDIVDYIVGKYNARADEGMTHFESEYREHWIAHLDGKRHPYVCLTRWKERCPSCEVAAKARGELDNQTFNGMRGKTMHAMLVRIISFTPPKKPTQDVNEKAFRIWRANNYNKGKGFMEQFTDLLDENEEYKNFSNWEDGRSIKLTFKGDSFDGKNYVYVGRIDFIERENQYDDSVESKLCCLDGLFIRKSPEQLKSVIENGTEDAESSKGNGQSSSKAKEEDLDDDSESDFQKGDYVQHKKLGRCVIVKVTEDGLTLQDSKEKTHKEVDPDECSTSDPDDDWGQEKESKEEEPEDDWEEEEKPKKGKPKAK